MSIHMSRTEIESTTPTMNESAGRRGRRSNRSAFALLRGAALIAFSFLISSTLALAATPLTLIGGWTNAPFGTRNADVEVVSGIVHFRGAIANGSSQEPFVLPAGFRPASSVYVKVDLCGSANGRLFITPAGDVIIQEENSIFSNAQCFTSLDGASFALSGSGFTGLSLINGWTTTPFGTSNPGVKNINGIVTFRGAIRNGSSSAPFVLPSGFRPASTVYVPVDLCNATNGRLHISSNGTVLVEAENGTFSNAQCFTSLDGASFATSGSGFTGLSLINGWTNHPFGTSSAAVKNINGIVTFRGAIASGSASEAFVLPSGFRPTADVYVPIDLCGATNGRLQISSSGAVFVEAENGTFSNAQCFTSLDGVSFGK